MAMTMRLPLPRSPFSPETRTMARTPVTVPRLEHHQVALMNAFILVKLRLKPGDALFIPSFWLHYVHGSSSPKSSQRRGADSAPIPWLSMNLFFTHRIRPTFRPQQDRRPMGSARSDTDCHTKLHTEST